MALRNKKMYPNAREIASEGIQSIAMDKKQNFIRLNLDKSSPAPIASTVRDNLFHAPSEMSSKNNALEVK